MARAIWKGAISFGLVHIPVSLVSATSSERIDFDWLDKRTLDPVGYKRVNKKSGKEVKKENIVKGIQHEKGKYVLLSEEEIRSSHPKSTQTIDIFSFINSTDIPLENIDTPYYLAPDKRGEKVYALLREALSSSNKVGLANVVLHTKQHLAAVMVIDSALVLILLRWPNEVRGIATLELTSATTKPELSKSELNMAKRLISDMTEQWNPDQYKDTFHDKIMALVAQKVKAGKIKDVETEFSEPQPKSADIIDLTELLKRSLGGGTKPTAKKTTAKSTARAKSSTKVKDAKPKSATTKAPAKSSPKSASEAKPAVERKRAARK